MNALIREKIDDIIKLCRRYRVSTLELFGSAAGERFDAATSDFDFLVEYETTSPREHADCYFGLLFALNDLLGREVDLVERSAIHNPYFLKAIAKQRVLVYAA
jgi:predicted nucleotidyltransferase